MQNFHKLQKNIDKIGLSDVSVIKNGLKPQEFVICQITKKITVYENIHTR